MAILYLSNRSNAPADTAMFDKTTPYETRRKIETLFESAEKKIDIADNYIGRKTLDYLLSAKVPVRIITSSTTEKNFDAALEDFQKQYPSSVEIKTVDGVLHGRYVVADGKYFILDHSIKDFGSKPSAIIEIQDGTVQASIKKLFDTNW